MITARPIVCIFFFNCLNLASLGDCSWLFGSPTSSTTPLMDPLKEAELIRNELFNSPGIVLSLTQTQDRLNRLIKFNPTDHEWNLYEIGRFSERKCNKQYLIGIAKSIEEYKKEDNRKTKSSSSSISHYLCRNLEFYNIKCKEVLDDDMFAAVEMLSQKQIDAVIELRNYIVKANPKLEKILDFDPRGRILSLQNGIYAFLQRNRLLDTEKILNDKNGRQYLSGIIKTSVLDLCEAISRSVGVVVERHYRHYYGPSRSEQGSRVTNSWIKRGLLCEEILRVPGKSKDRPTIENLIYDKVLEKSHGKFKKMLLKTYNWVRDPS